MRDILIGILILIISFVVVYFIYTEKNTFTITDQYGSNNYKCGIVYKELNFNVYVFERYW